MNKLLLLMTILILSLGLGPLIATEGPPENPTFTQTEEQAFYTQLRAEIDKTEKSIVPLIKEVTDKNKNFEGDLKKEFNEEIGTLAAKETLFQNFENTPSIKDPDIRKKLLELFQKPVWEPKDMEEIKAFVEAEKAKWPAEQKALGH